MARKTPSEADLGIELTADEIAASTAEPKAEPIPDDYPEGGDPDPVIPDEPEPRKAKANEPAKVDGEPDAKPAKPPAGYVDQRALQEERRKARIMEERFNGLTEALNRSLGPKPEPKDEAPIIPDKNVDPVAWLEYIGGRVDKIEATETERAQARQAEEREQAEVDAALEVARPQFEEAIAADPTIQPTYSALLDSIAREIAFINRIPLQNPTLQQREFLRREMSRMENSHIKYAVSTGQNVADYMRSFAASRGVVAQQQAQAAQPQAEKSIPERQAQQRRHMSLSDAPGGGAPAKLTAKDIANMSAKQYADLVKKIGDAGIDGITGASGNA